MADASKCSDIVSLMRSRNCLAVAFSVLCCAVSAQTMYRCGNTFSQTPCGADAQIVPSTGKQHAPIASSTGQSEAQRLEGIVASSVRDRRRQDLHDKWLPEAEVALTSHRVACAQRQKELAASQYAYKQNLYGKTHAAQMASEMAAAAAMCDTKDRELQGKLDALGRECATLKCR